MSDIHPGLEILRNRLPDANKRRVFISKAMEMLENNSYSLGHYGQVANDLGYRWPEPHTHIRDDKEFRLVITFIQGL